MTSELIPIALNYKDSFVMFLPKLLNSILIIFLGIIVGKITGKIVYIFLKKIHIDEYLSTEHFSINFSDITSTFTRWWIYLGFLSAAFSKNVLGIQILSDWIMEINSFLLKVVGASLVFVVGLIIGEYIRDQISYTKTKYSRYVADIVFFLIMYIAFAIGLDIVGIPTFLINSVLIVILASFGLGFAIAFGLGFKSIFEDIAKGNKRKIVKSINSDAKIRRRRKRK